MSLPRKLECHVANCGKEVEYVADYADGVGTCRFHLKRLLDWVFEDRKSVAIFPLSVWNEEAA